MVISHLKVETIEKRDTAIYGVTEFKNAVEYKRVSEIDKREVIAPYGLNIILYVSHTIDVSMVMEITANKYALMEEGGNDNCYFADFSINDKCYELKVKMGYKSILSATLNEWLSLADYEDNEKPDNVYQIEDNGLNTLNVIEA